LTNEKLQILQMVQEGKITVDEASDLLEALESQAPPPAAGVDVAPSQDGALPASEAPAPTIPPEMERFRRFSYLAFAILLVITLLTGWGSYALFRRAEGRITFGFVTVSALFVLAFAATVLALWATTVPWLHVRISPAKDSAGTRLAISMPLPLGLAGWGLRFAHRFVDKETNRHLDAAGALVLAMKNDLGKPGADPIVVDVDDEDERVQVYIG
jgi:hypothetical protein